MKTNTHIAVVLDRSGSMASMKNEIIGGFNGFLDDQKQVEGTATMTLVQFDNEIDRLADFKPLAEIEQLTDKTYVPRGCTRLYDAIGLTVNSVKEAISKAAEKPDKVLVVILTDGMENASQEYNTDGIRDLLEERQKEGWEFSFIGANQDAILTAKGIGIQNLAANITFAATPEGAGNVMRSMSMATSAYRCSAPNEAFAYAKSDHDAQQIDPAFSHASYGKAVRSEDGYTSGKAGGAARAASMSPQKRSKQASTAAKARWSKKSV